MVDPTLTPTLSIADAFDPASDADWEAAAVRMLKGRPLEALTKQTADGLTFKPLYTVADRDVDRELAQGAPGTAPYVRGSTDQADWRVCRIVDAAAAESGAEIVHDLARGVDTVWLRGVFEPELFKQLGELESQPQLFFDAGADSDVVYAHAVRNAGDDVATAWQGAVYMDPLGELARRGRLEAPLETYFDRMAMLYRQIAERDPRFGSICVSLAPYHNAGAGMATELALFCATAVAYLRAMEARGIAVAQAAQAFEAVVPAGRHTFREAAKLRALRGLWSAILKQCGVDAVPPLRVHSMASERTVTVRDPWVNMLRATAQCFAGAIGGADVISTMPYDRLHAESSELGRRMAINTQLILQQETHLGFVRDPAGGSFFFEAATRQLQARAWELFQEIEARGGLVDALQDGTVQAQVRDQAEALQRDIARRKVPVVGVSAYPNLDEPTPQQRSTATPSATAGAAAFVPQTFQDLLNRAADETPAQTIAALQGEPVTVDGLPALREAEPFEQLRAGADAYAEKQGQRPSIFLANLGPIPKHKARATFAQNFFAAGGIEPLSNDGFSEADAVAKAFADSGARIAVLCAADDIYAELAEAAAKALKAAGVEQLWLAGKPGDRQERDAAAGVDRYIHMGCDVLAELHVALDVYGVER